MTSKCSIRPVKTKRVKFEVVPSLVASGSRDGVKSLRRANVFSIRPFNTERARFGVVPDLVFYILRTVNEDREAVRRGGRTYSSDCVSSAF
jgi:hypothetical protein